jgi:thioredoxin 1
MKEIKSYDDLENIFNANEDKLVVVDFFATWCGPCRTLGETLSSLSEDEMKNIVIVKVNVDEADELTLKYPVRSIPVLLYFLKGELVERTTGNMDKITFLQKVDEILSR